MSVFRIHYNLYLKFGICIERLCVHKCERVLSFYLIENKIKINNKKTEQRIEGNERGERD